MTNHEQPDSQPHHDTLPKDVSLEELTGILITCGIPIEKWGMDEAKTIDNLLVELQNGESAMWVDDQGIHRDVTVLWLDVIHETSDGDVFLLKEDRQEFRDGRVRRRDLPGSLGEKMKPNERPVDASMRALAEEIGVENITSHYVIGEEVKMYTPPTYPGLESRYTTYSHLVQIGTEDFRPEGYVEYQEDKVNYYVWKKLIQKDG